MSTAAATINGAEIVTKGNYHTLAARVLNNSGLVLSGSNITIGDATSTVTLQGNVILPEGVGLSVKIVQKLPSVADAKMGVIYMIPSTLPGSGDVYDEYMKVNKAAEGQPAEYVLEKIGSTALQVDNTFSPTSDNPQSGKALSFLSPSSITLLQSDAYVQEAASSTTTSAGAQSYIDSRIQAALQNGRVIDAVDATSMSPTNELKEGSILIINVGTNDTVVNLSGLSCVRNATAEIWIAIPSTVTTAPSIQWPVSGTGATTTWLELTQPSSMPKGYLYGVVMRNDGRADGPAHYILNLAYQYDITQRG